MRLAISEAVNATGGSELFILDELGALGASDGLIDALVRLRELGG
jgi:hypothetical protein